MTPHVDNEPRDRPAETEPEIEVTPEMIEAGELAYDSFYESYSPHLFVLEVYKAMEMARRL